jgi:DNA polymerase III subunit delta'
MNLYGPTHAIKVDHTLLNPWKMYGYDWAVNILREHIIRGNPRHAYLLTGPQGIGRRTLALRMAQALNCPSPEAPGIPCFNCHTCKQIERMQHPDLLVVQSDPQSRNLKVEQIRDLQRSLSLTPYEARYRIAILLRFEEANPNAANALLKTLEEPAPPVILILTAESSESLLPTIVSRCEVIRLGPLSYSTVSDSLQSHWGIQADEANLLAHLSGGRLGYAVHLFQEPEQLSQRHEWLEEHKHLLIANRIERFNYADKLTKDKDKNRDKLHSLLEVWLSLWRDILLRATGAQTPLVNIDREIEINNLARQLGIENSYKMVENIERTMELIDNNINPRLVIEDLMINFPILLTS